MLSNSSKQTHLALFPEYHQSLSQHLSSTQLKIKTIILLSVTSLSTELDTNKSKFHIP